MLLFVFYAQRCFQSHKSLGVGGKPWGYSVCLGLKPATTSTKKLADGFDLSAALCACQWNLVVADAWTAFDGSMTEPVRPPSSM